MAQAETSTLVGTVCSSAPIIVGHGRMYGPCGVIVRRGTRTDTLWLAKSLNVRDGVHKLLGLQNELSGF